MLPMTMWCYVDSGLDGTYMLWEDCESLDPFEIADIPSAEKGVRSSMFARDGACLGSKCVLAL
jgi:hypothetical protein